MRRIFFRISVFAALMVAACVPDPGAPSVQNALTIEHEKAAFKFANNPQPNERIVFSGFSIVPPQGENWIETPRLPEPDPNSHAVQARLSFVKVMPQTEELGPHSIYAKVDTIFLSDWDRRLALTDPHGFMQFRMKYTLANIKVSITGKQQLISQQASLDRSVGYECFKYDLRAQDSDVSGFPDFTFLIDFHAYECIDPSAKLIVTLYYSQRVNHAGTSADIAREGEGFLKSIKFTSPIS